MRSVLFVWLTGLVCGLAALACSASSVSQPQVAIIIDDLGYNFSTGLSAIALKHPITIAIIPSTPHARALANVARNNDKEIMLHAPMQSKHAHKIEEGFHINMTRQELNHRLGEMMIDFGPFSGINNHGGSLFSQNPEKISWFFDYIEEYPLYFIDSRTSAETVWREEAAGRAIPFDERDVFLDNERTPEHIRAQLKRLKSIALRYGSAVAIGHPYEQTLAVLREELPHFQAEGIELVFASELVSPVQNDSKNTTTAESVIQTTKNGAI